MQLAHLVDETLLRVTHVGQRLARFGVGEEYDEIDRVPVTQGHADLRVVLEPADPGPMARARVDDHVRPAFRVHGNARGRQYPDEGVIDRPLEGARVDDNLILEVQHRRLARLFVFDKVVAPLPEGVPEEYGALHEVCRILEPVPPY